MFKPLLTAVLLSAVLAGCMENDGQRALVGAGIGAVAADMAGVDPVTGAALGAGAGALCNDAGIGICN